MDGRHKRRFRAIYGEFPSHNGVHPGKPDIHIGGEKDKNKIEDTKEKKEAKEKRKDTRIRGPRGPLKKIRDRKQDFPCL